jgi:hypothetical protein
MFFYGLKILAKWFSAIIKGIALGVACAFAFLMLMVGWAGRSLVIHLTYLLKLAILTCLLLPGIFGHLSHFGAHTIAGEEPATGMGRAFMHAGLLLISLIVTVIVPVIQLGCLIIDTLFMLPLHKEILLDRFEEGLSIHRWMLEFLDDLKE